MVNTVHEKSYYMERIKSLVNLPTLPIIATEIIRVAREDRLSINQILPIIEKDPPLAMKVLKYANSPFYGLKEKVKSLRHAIVVIGLAQLTQLATAFSVIRVLNDDQSGQVLPWRQFWEHSSATGYMAQLIAEELNIFTTENLYSVGLLHDIGKLILYRVDSRNYYRVFLLSTEKNISSEAAELEIFGFTHAESGSWIAERWELPQGIRDGIRYHHAPEKMDEPRYTDIAAVTSLANRLTNFRISRFGTCATVLKEETEDWKLLQARHFPDSELSYTDFLESMKEKTGTVREMVQLMQL